MLRWTTSDTENIIYQIEPSKSIPASSSEATPHYYRQTPYTRRREVPLCGRPASPC
jgi:hypothetical protein